MVIFLTGATGFIGSRILAGLLERGHTVRCLVRERSAHRLPDSKQVIPVKGTIHDQSSFEAAMKGCDAVIHTVGIIAETGDNTFTRVHTYGTIHLVNAMLVQGVKRLIHTSALGTRPAAMSRYHRTKYDAEVYIQTFPMIEYTIFRPSIVHGPAGEFTRLLKRFATLPCFPLPGSYPSLFQPVFVDDVAAVFLEATESSAATGMVLDLAGPRRFTLPQMVEIMARALDKKPPRGIHIPMYVMAPAAYAAEVACPILGLKPPINLDQLVMLSEDSVTDSQDAWELFGLFPADYEVKVNEYANLVGRPTP